MKYELSEQQLEAVNCEKGPVLVIAGAGTGKTSVVSHRFVHLVKDLKITTERILCVTFTRHASHRLREKITHVLVEKISHHRDYMRIGIADFKKIKVTTFHSLCKEIILEAKGNKDEAKFVHPSKWVPILREHIKRQFPNIRAIYKTSLIMEKLRWICKSEEREFTEEDLFKVGVKITGIFDRDKFFKNFPFQDLRRIYDDFSRILEVKNWLTLDDMILEAQNYLKHRKDVLDRWRSKFDAILCDEFQDVDPMQFNILISLADVHNNVFCVGDPDQSIYGFRGAMPHIFKEFEDHFAKKNLKVQIKQLTKNFRSTPEILKVSNSLILNNYKDESKDIDYKKELETDNKRGSSVYLNILDNKKDQAKSVIKKIIYLKNRKVPMKEILVLARNRSHYRYITDVFFKFAIGWEDWSAEHNLILNKAEIKDLIGWLGVAFCKTESDLWARSLTRVYMKPTVGVGPTRFAKLQNKSGASGIFEKMHETAAKDVKMLVLLKKILWIRDIAADESITFQEKCEKIVQVSEILKFHEKSKDATHSIESFLDSEIIKKSDSWETVMSEIQQYIDDDKDDKVKFSTIHGVKGLEFDHVFVVSLSEGNLPSSWGKKLCEINIHEENEYVEEERRVFYVALTRARKTLNLFVDKGESETSEFIDDVIDHVHIRKESEFDEDIEQHTKDWNILEENEDEEVDTTPFFEE